MDVKKHFRVLLFLIGLLLVLDGVLVYLYPTVNLVRATLVALVAFGVCKIPYCRKLTGLPPYIAFIPIAFAAYGSVLLIGQGVLVSRTISSALVHLLILIGVYGCIVYFRRSK